MARIHQLRAARRKPLAVIYPKNSEDRILNYVSINPDGIYLLAVKTSESFVYIAPTWESYILVTL